jgi:DNA-binding transcriptional MerR regulator
MGSYDRSPDASIILEMTDTTNKTGDEVATELGISAQTLLNWTKEFATFLSTPSASADGMRRYTSDDGAVLKHIKEHLTAGLTFEETAEELKNAGYADGVEQETPQSAIAVSSAQQGFGVLTDTLRAMIENQQTIQNSLQVNRNLLGVIIQDNFNLKEENAKLRERMLKQEQELSELKRRDSDYRLYLEQRLNHMEGALRAEASKSIWQRLFGG